LFGCYESTFLLTGFLQIDRRDSGDQRWSYHSQVNRTRQRRRQGSYEYWFTWEIQGLFCLLFQVLVNISKVQDDEVGDGTTSVTVLAAELLRQAEILVEKKIHPQTIIDGYRIASKAALVALEKSAVDRSNDPIAFRKDLHSIARTTLSSKVLAQDRDHFATLACDAVLRLKGSTDLSHIQIIKKAGGKLSESYLDEGFILDKKFGVNQPKRLENVKIMVANTAMDTDKIKIFGARVKVGLYTAGLDARC
jgi:T-complex protein 1 subunit beta